MNKTCRKCGTAKDLADFSQKSSSVDGHSPVCKECTKARRLARKASAPAKTIAPVLEAKSVSTEGLTNVLTDYRPSKELVATWAAVLLSASDGNAADNLIFLGPSGSGKTEAVKYLGGLSGLPLYSVDASAMTDPESWFGTREVVAENGVPVTKYTPSDFVTALGQRCVLRIDEVNRVSDAVRNILLPLLDDQRSVTNPLTGERVVRHPQCFVIMTGNAGLMFTGTYAVDPALMTRALTTNFDYLEAAEETEVVISRTGVDRTDAELLVRFAGETRSRAKANEDFPPVSTREVLTAARLIVRGLDPNTAVHQAVINAADGNGGGESVRANLEMIWTGIRPAKTSATDDAPAPF